MTSSELIIEKMNVDVFANDVKDSNKMLYQIAEELKRIVLPEVKKKLDEFNPRKELAIDQLNLKFDLAELYNWHDTLGKGIAEELIKTCENELHQTIKNAKEKHENLLDFGMNDLNDNFLVGRFFYFLMTGYFSPILFYSDLEKDDHWHTMSVENSQSDEQNRYKFNRIRNFAEMERFWLKSDQNELLFWNLVPFLRKNSAYQLRFLNQTSASFLEVFINFLCEHELYHFLVDFFRTHTKNDQLATFLFKKMIELAVFGKKITLLEFIEALNSQTTQFLHILTEKLKKNTIFFQKYHEKFIKSMKNDPPHSSDSLSKTILRKSDHSLFVFIQYLRSDLSLREKLDAQLTRFYQNYNQKFDRSNWCHEFAQFIQSKKIITDILIELEELKPINGQVRKPEFFATELVELVKALEDQLDRIKTQLVPNIDLLQKENKATALDETVSESPIKDQKIELDQLASELDLDFLSKSATDIQTNQKAETHQESIEEESNTILKSKNLDEKQLDETFQRLIDSDEGLIHQIIPIQYAGIILLNPFFHALFKNMQLQNEQGEWISEEHQGIGVYLLNYLIMNTWQVSEDELLLNKILTGFMLDQVLPTFQDLEEATQISGIQLAQQLEEKELPALLTAIQENWRPMRNCTWKGFKKDFLVRKGQLTQKEDLQYLLTVESHTLDLMLPHKNWGHSMVKFSWMKQVLNVEWGT